MESNIATILMDRRITVWKNRQRRRYKNFKLKTVRFINTDQVVVTVFMCGAAFIFYDALSSTIYAANQPQAKVHISPVAQAPPQPDVSQLGRNSETAEEEIKVNLRLSYEMTLPATQTVSEAK